jgi:hypothetical protein
MRTRFLSGMRVFRFRMRHNHAGRIFRESRHQPPEEGGCRGGACELGNNESGRVGGPDAGERIGSSTLAQPQIIESRPNVATNSLKSWALPLRMCWDAKNTGLPNIR